MIKNVYLFWHKHNEKHGNFGDELNSYLFSRLFSDNYNFIYTGGHYITKNKWQLIQLILRLIKAGHYRNISEFRNSVEFNLLFNKATVGIGSVIHVHKTNNCQIWGTGLMRKDDIINEANFHAVRGYETIKRLNDLNIDTSGIAVGDPAVLLPLVYHPKKKAEKIGIIPHHLQFESTKAKFGHLKNVCIIDLLDPIEKIVNRIYSCKYTLSSSLHGIIVSHAYGINSIWCDFSSEKLGGDNIKFYDYFSSLGIRPYDPKSSEEEILKLISSGFSDDYMPKPEKIKFMQRELLRSAPFDLKESLQRLIN